MTDKNELLKIGDFARLAGTNLRTLRYYEELGLLEPSHRSDGGFRYYRRTDLNRLAAIRTLQDLGLHLDRIRDLLDRRGDRSDRVAFLERVRSALQEEDRLIEESLSHLEAQRAKVASALDKLSQCRPCPHTPTPNNNFCEPCINTGEALPEFLSALF